MPVEPRLAARNREVTLNGAWRCVRRRAQDRAELLLGSQRKAPLPLCDELCAIKRRRIFCEDSRGAAPRREVKLRHVGLRLQRPETERNRRRVLGQQSAFEPGWSDFARPAYEPKIA